MQHDIADIQPRGHILAVDDDPMVLEHLLQFSGMLGYVCHTAGTLAAGLERVRGHPYDLVLLDIYLPDSSGLAGIAEFQAAPSSPAVVVITGDGDAEVREAALRGGAWYYLEKPIRFETFRLFVQRILRSGQRAVPERKLLLPSHLVAHDPQTLGVLRQVSRLAAMDGNVLITGETGTGKELIAKLIHESSDRAQGPFVVVDCGAIPENLTESILFGHQAGAFTDAKAFRSGLIQQADKGTLFLDELAELNPSQQVALLRLIQEKTFRPLGSATEIAIDCRFVAATNQDIAGLQALNRFRMDLYYRIGESHLVIPPLRERPRDIDPLITYYVRQICATHHRETLPLTPDLLALLRTYPWPGNVRELINTLRACIAAAQRDDAAAPHHLPARFRVLYHQLVEPEAGMWDGGDALPGRAFVTQVTGPTGPRIELEGAFPEHAPKRPPECPPNCPLEHAPEDASVHSSGHPPNPFPTLKSFRTAAWSRLEGEYLDTVLAQSGGRFEEARRIAGISKTRFYDLLKKHGKKLDG